VQIPVDKPVYGGRPLGRQFCGIDLLGGIQSQQVVEFVQLRTDLSDQVRVNKYVKQLFGFSMPDTCERRGGGRGESWPRMQAQEPEHAGCFRRQGMVGPGEHSPYCLRFVVDRAENLQPSLLGSQFGDKLLNCAVRLRGSAFRRYADRERQATALPYQFLQNARVLCRVIGAYQTVGQSHSIVHFQRFQRDSGSARVDQQT
jgi:hypothetical protein